MSDKDDAPLPDLASAQAYDDMLPRIKALHALDPEDLSIQMDSLKKALHENPAACSLMLPEDIGELVAAVRKITGITMVDAVKTKAAGAKSKAKKSLTAEELEEAFGEL